jgi:hypothetical protein
MIQHLFIMLVVEVEEDIRELRVVMDLLQEQTPKELVGQQIVDKVLALDLLQVVKE